MNILDCAPHELILFKHSLTLVDFDRITFDHHLCRLFRRHYIFRFVRAMAFCVDVVILPLFKQRRDVHYRIPCWVWITRHRAQCFTTSTFIFILVSNCYCDSDSVMTQLCSTLIELPRLFSPRLCTSINHTYKY
jgi:hypothetical protein